MRLRDGKTGSGKGAGRMVAQAVATARATGVSGQILVRGDSAYGSRKVVRACRRRHAQFSLVPTRNTAVQRAIDTIAEDAWTPVRYPGAVQDPDTGAWTSDAEVAETTYTAFASTKDAVTARLIVRRVKTPTTRTRCSRCGDITRSSPTPPNRSPTPTSPIANTRSSKPSSPTSPAAEHPRARSATLRRKIVNIPARLARPQRRPILHLPSHWPGVQPWLRLWRNTIGYSPTAAT